VSDYARGGRGIALAAATRTVPQALPHMDWLRHILIVTGSAVAVASFQTAASGSGAIPWVSPDLDLLEEDRVMALVDPPDGSAGLSLAGARALAGQLRSAIEVNQQRAGIVTVTGGGQWLGQDSGIRKPPDPHHRHRFLAEPSHAVWLYHVFSLSLRDVELILAERGVIAAYESIRRWRLKFGASFARSLRRRRPCHKWHLDEVFIRVQAELHYLWRAVDQHGTCSISWCRAAATPGRRSAPFGDC
jgi:hypothetical protein